MLQLDNIHAAYGSIVALRGISITVNSGELVALVGVNGAGKSTLLSTIVGIVSATQGTVTFEGKPLLGQPPETIIRRGIALVPENRRIFAGLTVAENLRLGAAIRPNKADIQRDIDEMCTRFPRLGERLSQPGGTLSGGEQQMLAVARALMSRPKLLMLDEPSLGLAPIIVDEIFGLIAELHTSNVTILLVEQNVTRALDIADRVYLLDTGRIDFAGTPAELREQVDITGAYFGVG